MSDFTENLERCAREVRRWPVRTCFDCGGKGTVHQEVYNDFRGDRDFADVKCSTCGGKGKVGGGQPGLSLFFHSVKERNEFKAKILRMRGIKWTDEGNTLETIQAKKWKG